MKLYLERCAAILNLVNKVEIFPKAITLKNKGIGFAITLPCFKYATDKIEEFIALCEKNKISNADLQELPAYPSNNDNDEILQAPPCLQKLYHEGVPVGGRDNALFCFGVYAKMRFGEEELKNKLHYYNEKVLLKPFAGKELKNLEKIEKSLRKEEYFYLCDVEPMCSRCNSSICRRMQYGLGNDLITNKKDFIVFDKIIKQDYPDDPLYFVTVNGEELRPLNISELSSMRTFSEACAVKLNFYPSWSKSKIFRDLLNKALEKTEIMPVSEDATEYGQFKQLFERFFQEHPSGNSLGDVVKGYLFYDDGWVYFEFRELKQFLYLKRFDLDDKQINNYLRKYTNSETGETTIVRKVDGQNVRLRRIKREPPASTGIKEEYLEQF